MVCAYLCAKNSRDCNLNVWVGYFLQVPGAAGTVLLGSKKYGTRGRHKDFEHTKVAYPQKILKNW